MAHRENMHADKANSFPLAATAAIFALAFLLPAWPWLSGAVTIPWDAKSQFWPQLQFLATSFAKGESPFWTPNVFAGWPQIADPQSLIFSPFHVLLAWFTPTPSFRAADAITFLHLFLGGLGIIMIFRDRGWHPAGALVAALCFAFGGSCAARLQHTGQVESIAWLPVAIWLLTRALERNSWRAGAAAGVVGGLIAIGRDQVGLLSIYVLVGLVVAHWLAGPERGARVRASIGPLAAGCAAGALVATIPVVLTLLLAGDSNRPEIGFDFAGRGSLHPVHLLTLVFPDLFGAAAPDVEYWAPPGYAWNQAFGMAGLWLAQNMGELYAGALLPIALVLGLTRGIVLARGIRIYVVAALLVLLYALGWYTPVFRAMYELPGVALYRRPADAGFVLVTLLAIITGYVVHRVVSGTMPAPKRPQRIVEIGLAIVLLALALGLAAFVENVRVAVVPVVTALLFTAAALVVLRLAQRIRVAWAAAAVLAAFTAADLRWNNAPNISTGLPPAQFDVLRPTTADETVRLIKARRDPAPDRRDRVEMIAVGYHWPNLSLVQDLDHVFGQNPLRLRWFAEATNAQDTVAVIEQRPFSRLYPGYRSAFADLLGVGLIVTGVPIDKIDPSVRSGDFPLLARTKDAYVYENPRVLPRVSLMSDWQVADFASLVRDGWPPGIDPRRTVLLERLPVPVPPLGGTGTASLTRYTNTDVEVTVEASRGGVLVLNDVWHPWWRATLDGAPVEILKANGIFRAVAMPAGRHTVRFTFHPFAGALAQLGAKIGLR